MQKIKKVYLVPSMGENILAFLPDDCQPEFNFDEDENEEGGEI